MYWRLQQKQWEKWKEWDAVATLKALTDDQHNETSGIYKHSPNETHSTALLCSLVNQFSSVAQPCLTLCDPMNHSSQASLSITNSWSYSNSCPSSQWCHPAISSSVVPFSSCPLSLPASGSCPMSQLLVNSSIVIIKAEISMGRLLQLTYCFFMHCLFLLKIVYIYSEKGLLFLTVDEF